MSPQRFDPEPSLSCLKDFQRRTVDHVFECLYRGQRRSNRFLVADEVGLGKTMVARGLIARALHEMHDKTDRMDIIYVCSNAAIAQQNINRLNVMGEKGFTVASRLTLLPLNIGCLTSNRANFVSFTPGTTFDLKSRGGIAEERAALYRMLKNARWLAKPEGLRRLLQGNVGDGNWRWWSNSWNAPIDQELAGRFLVAVGNNEVLRNRLTDLSKRAALNKRSVGWEERFGLVGDLRRALATTCLEALEPDLVILDEFQRFRNLLDGDDEAAELARALFNYTDRHGNDVKVLLLSATPYKMLSLDLDRDEDHHTDFLRTLEFLLNDKTELELIKSDLQSFRQALYSTHPGMAGQIEELRAALRRRLGRVLCRTERVGSTLRQDAMLAEVSSPTRLEVADLQAAAAVDRLSREIGAREPIEYWKSAPYLPSFLRRYEFREKLDRVADAPEPALLEQFGGRNTGCVKHQQIKNYRRLDPGNARMRVLFGETLDRGLWKLLWLPPSLPYTRPSGPFEGLDGTTKQLVFSTWNLVPDAIAATCSYEAERRMVENAPRFEYENLGKRMKPLLRFSQSDNRLTGMTALVLLMPVPELAGLVDPLEITCSHSGAEPIPLESMLAQVRRRLEPLVGRLLEEWSRPSDRQDQRWYWAAPALLSKASKPFMEWCRAAERWEGGEADADDEESESSVHFPRHLAEFVTAMEGGLKPPLGRPPDDLVQVLAELAVAGPGTCALRSLRRVTATAAYDSPELLNGAARISWGFRTLFNLPETIALLRGSGDEDSYWRLALQHCAEGNIQALLDEQAHVLRESLGLMDWHAPGKVASAIAEKLAGVLSLRTAQLGVDDLSCSGGKIVTRQIRMRCRFALRFAEIRNEGKGTLTRVETVRDAFNSPFRPFVMATTSIGQEGLDFHTWCHSVVHWNLPSNPVDLEQREGRVHRYKGHAVRKNVALRYGLKELRRGWDHKGDPWARLFARAASDAPATAGQIVPYWIFETDGGYKVERRVPMLPLSREVEQYQRLKRSLALYRLVFGQPRQEDLLAYLADRMSEDEAARIAREWRIDLTPGQKDDDPLAG